MQIAVELFEKALGASLALKCVKNIKFLQIISPKDVTEVKYAFNKIVREDSEIKVQVTVSDADNTYAKLSLVCREL
jgi:3-hydroxyacyl-[acyl-carrier-protein] dehydratase